MTGVQTCALPIFDAADILGAESFAAYGPDLRFRWRVGDRVVEIEPDYGSLTGELSLHVEIPMPTLQRSNPPPTTSPISSGSNVAPNGSICSQTISDGSQPGPSGHTLTYAAQQDAGHKAKKSGRKEIFFIMKFILHQ